MRPTGSLATVLVLFCLAAATPAAAQAVRGADAPGATTIVVVRHAEKATDDPRDPRLTGEGERRAEALVAVLQDAGVVAIYSTQFRRTRATVEPLAHRLQVPVSVREIAAGGAQRYADELAREIFTRHAGGSVVVVGHSNTVPQIVQALSGRVVAEMSEQEHDHLFVVVVPRHGEPRLFRTRYGAADPR